MDDGLTICCGIVSVVLYTSKSYWEGHCFENLRNPAESMIHLLKRMVRFEKKIQLAM